jgi:hypothetical protein
MLTLNSLQEAPTLVEFCNKIREEEKESTRHQVPVYDLKFYLDGTLGVKSKDLQVRLPISEKTIPDLARIADIPVLYLKRCDRRLQSVSFNWRLHQKVVANKPVQLVLRDGVVGRILNTNLLPAPRLAVLDTVANAKPELLQKDDLKIIKYTWDGQFDISVIAPILLCEPRKGDPVAFGVNVSEGRDGAIQVQGAAFRCWCSNGAVNRICDSRQHRLRRPINSNERQEQLLSKISVFAQEAWKQSSEHMESLPQLVNTSIDLNEREPLRSRLRQAPFFLSVRVINQVLERLEFEVARHQEGATLYDLYNAMTYLGTHNQQLSFTYRSRLRAGAGEFSRHEPRICSTCRQLLLK